MHMSYKEIIEEIEMLDWEIRHLKAHLYKDCSQTISVLEIRRAKSRGELRVKKIDSILGEG